ncbi:hypothetical protein [Streptomyces sp. NPDC058653]|uniref:hypothetical protein n=1 Tax=Streptomyces sp. NPDC058653 TaxID=3346576 RepID=UPI0036558CE3
MTADMLVPPHGCRWCGDEQGHHGSQWAPIIGLHQWIEPTQRQILARMRDRRAARLDAPPAVVHTATVGVSPSDGGADIPFCVHCETGGCRPWMRAQARLNQWRSTVTARTTPPPLPPWEETVEEAAHADDRYWERDTDNEE